MKVLFDEDVPARLAPFLLLHEIHTVAGMRWGSIKNGALLSLIEREGFDVFLTGDKNMNQQQRLDGRPFAVLILSAINSPVIRTHVQKISDALDNAERGAVGMINCGVFVPHSRRFPR